MFQWPFTRSPKLLALIYYGEEDAGALRELQRAAIRKGLLFNAAAAGIIFLLSRSVALLFAGKADGETFRLAVEAIRVQALSLPLYMLVYNLQKLSDGHRTQTGSESVRCSFGVSRSCLLCFPDGLYAERKGSVECDTG